VFLLEIKILGPCWMIDIQSVEAQIRNNSVDANRKAMEEIYGGYAEAGEQEIEQLAPLVIYILWKVPKFKAQKEFVNELILGTDARMRAALLNHLVRHWNDVELVRRDKFYYLMKKIVECYELTVENIDYLFNVTCNTDLRSYIIRCVVERIERLGGLEEYMLDFISRCPPNLLACFEALRFRREDVLRFAKKPEVCKKNRNALCSLISN
jgi:hypothetical protein